MDEEKSEAVPPTRKNMEISVAEASSIFPGFRFSPTDEELLQYYLKKKLQGFESGLEVIPEVDICRHEPWDLPAHSVIQSDNEWFFFTSRGRKYPNGTQSKRATVLGYWKATGKERSVKVGSNLIGTKRTLVFHTGRAPKGQRTEWIMHEYCAAEKSQDDMVVCRLRKSTELHMGDNSRTTFDGQRDFSSENGGTMLDGAKVGSFSKECSNSSNSNSAEKVGTGLESDEKISNEFDSFSLQQLEEDDEDFYADIMKDDIIALDESSLNEIRVRGKPERNTAHKNTDQNPDRQGATDEQHRAGKKEPENQQPGQSASIIPENLSIDSVPTLSSQEAAENALDKFAISRYKLLSMSMFLVFLIILLIMFSKRDPWKVKWLIDAFKLGEALDINWNHYLPSVTWRRHES